MRQGQQNNNNKRMRGRNRKGPNPLSRSYESNGPDVKIRGTALHIAEKYVQLARDAQVSGDRVAAESYLQHAEHYYRVLNANGDAHRARQVMRDDVNGTGTQVSANGVDLQPGEQAQPAANPHGPSAAPDNGPAKPEDSEP